MNKHTTIWLIVAASLLILGLLIFTGVMMVYQWDFTKLSTVKYETNTYEIHDKFQNISIKTDTADICFLPSEDGACRVVCYEESKQKHAVTVQDGHLVIDKVNQRKWYDHIGGINFGNLSITVYIPKGEYGALAIKASTGDVAIPKDFKFASMDISASTGDVTNYASASGRIKIKASTGDIHVENLTTDSLDLSVSTGKVTASGISCHGDVKVKVTTGKTRLTDMTCRSLISDGNTGSIYLKNVVATERFSIERSTGDVRFEACDAAEISIKTDTGDVKGSVLSDKVFVIKTDTGDYEVPETTTGGKCSIQTDTGDIKIFIE